ncbi:hypothetical protein PG990_001987 [Apiospora arundinis]
MRQNNLQVPTSMVALGIPPECSQERWLGVLRKTTNRKIAEIRPKGGIDHSDLMWAVLGESHKTLYENDNRLSGARPTAQVYKERFKRLDGFIKVNTLERITGGTYESADDFVQALLDAATATSRGAVVKYGAKAQTPGSAQPQVQAQPQPTAQPKPQPKPQPQPQAQPQPQKPKPEEPKGLVRSPAAPPEIKATQWVAPYKARLGKLLGVRIALPTGQEFKNSVIVKPYEARIDRNTDEDIVRLESEMKQRIAYAVFTRWVANMYVTGEAQDLAVFVQNDLADMANHALNLNDVAVATIDRLSQASNSIQPPSKVPQSSHMFRLKTNSPTEEEHQERTQASNLGSFYDLVAHLERDSSFTSRKRTFAERENMQQALANDSQNLVARLEREGRVSNIWKIAIHGKDLARYSQFLSSWRTRFGELAGQVLQEQISVPHFVDKMKDTFLMPYVEVAYFGNDYHGLVPVVQSLITHTLSKMPKNEDVDVQTDRQVNKRRCVEAAQDPATENAL